MENPAKSSATCKTTNRFKTALYKHQQDAVEKLSHIKVGALYMEMGTGKTRTALELAAKRLDAEKVDAVLWLCPCSVKTTIAKEIQKHARSELAAKIRICGIESVSASSRIYLELHRAMKEKRHFLIVDESNLVKNHRAKRSMRIQMLSEFTRYKLILNGTPISRNMADLYSQWRILDWRILGFKNYHAFASKHIDYDDKIRGRIRGIRKPDEIVEKIAPYTFQVLKKDCVDLPDKTFETRYFDLTNGQREHYADAKYQYLADIDELHPATIYRLFNALQHVVCGKRVLTGPAKQMKTEPYFQNPRDNPRVQALLSVVGNIEDKIIIWCRYIHEIETIEQLLKEVYGEQAAVSVFGAMNMKKRDANIQQFRETARFLITNKNCGGYGLNLQFCHYMIYYTNDWDLATRAQSEDRVHRIGQESNVHIVDICADSTIDERIVNCLLKKKRMVDDFKNVLEEKKFDIGKWLDGLEMGGEKRAEEVSRKECV